MKKGQELSIKICYNCKESCLTSDKNRHSKQSHEQINISILLQLIDQMVITSSAPQFSSFANRIIQILLGLKRSVDGLIQLIQQKQKQVKIKHGLGISTESLTKKVSYLLSGEADKIKTMNCHDIHQIYMKLFDASPSNTFKMAESIQSIGQKIGKELNQGISKINQQIERMTSIKGSQKRSDNSKKSEQKKQVSKPQQANQQQINFCQLEEKSEVRPSRTNQMIPKKQIREYLRVRDLQKCEISERFNIILKVIKIVKTFTNFGKDKIEIVGGDQTGVANCVFDDIQSIINVGNVLQVVNGRLYDFKDSIRQIQDDRNTMIKKSDLNMKITNKNFNLSQRIEKKRKSSLRDNYYERKSVPKKNQNHRVDVKNKQNSQGKHVRKQQRVSDGQEYQQQKSQKQKQPTLKKVGQIQPGDSGISLKCQVYEIIDIQERTIKCYIGDETAIVKIQIPEYFKQIKEGATVNIQNLDAVVIDSHIIMKTNKRTQIRKLGEKLTKINISVDISKEEWEEEG